MNSTNTLTQGGNQTNQYFNINSNKFIEPTSIKIDGANHVRTGSKIMNHSY